MLVDSHCHLNSLSDKLRKEVIDGCSAGYIILDSSISPDTSLASLELSREHSFVYTSLGFHPFCAAEFRPSTIGTYQKLIEENKKIIAIGEIGLDFKAESDAHLQEEVFRKFLELAKNKGLAVIIHNRFEDPGSDTCRALEIIEDVFGSFDKVIFHCFSYSPGLLENAVEKGGMISFSLNVLRRRKNIISSLERCPLENILLETDSPYMKINGSDSTPLDIKEVYNFVSSLKHLKKGFLEETVFSNFQRVFSI